MSCVVTANNKTMNTRYRHTEYTITEKEARKHRRDELDRIRAEIENLKSQMREVREAPLNLNRWKYEPVNPGEPGYEDLNEPFDPRLYQGETRWYSHLSPKTGTP